MAQAARPTAPLVVIFGSTGTGKSDLAVDLATWFNGEIVNADAMQMYKGLPIITNKISTEEQRGIPHHLFDNIGLDEHPWTVAHFKQEASRIIKEIHTRGKLPILVGGTHYYTAGLLFQDKLVEESPTSLEVGELMEDTAKEYPILDAPAEVMLAKLREVDPVMAERWHPNDIRKIRRSLEIFLTTGKRASDIYSEQAKRKDAKRSPEESAPNPWQALFFWVHTDRKVLIDRLDRRIMKMMQRGLLGEVQELYRYVQDQEALGHAIDRSKGIWQSIGFSQFEKYLKTLAEEPESPELELLKHQGVEDTQAATRRYAQYQIKFVTKKLVPPLREEGQLDNLYLLDSTDIKCFDANVLGEGANLTRKFLAGEEMPSALDISDIARQVLTSTVEASTKRETRCNRTCEICHTVIVTEEAWDRHIKGSSHRRLVMKQKKAAMVAVQRPTDETVSKLIDVEPPP